MTELSFTTNGGVESVDFIANKSWTVTSSENWCKVSPSVGVANDIETVFSISVSCNENTQYDARECSITIIAGALSHMISVRQDEKSAIILKDDTYNISYKAQSLRIPIDANCDYTVSIPEYCKSWISVISTKGLSTNYLTLDISENTSYDPRDAIITIINGASNLSSKVTIIQEQNSAVIASKNEFKVSADEQLIEIPVKSNVDFSVKIDGSCQGWIHYVETKALTSSNVVVQIDENTQTVQREGKVWLVNEDWGISESVIVHQEEAGYIEVTPSSVEIEYKAQEFSVGVDANVEYDVAISTSAQSWLTFVSSKSTSKKLYFKATKNDQYDRDAVVSLSTKDNKVSTEFSVKQGTPVVFSDENFKTYCVENFDTDHDGEVSKSEALEVIVIEVITDNIRNINGITEFKNLMVLKAMGGNAKYQFALGDCVYHGDPSSLPDCAPWTSVASGQLNEVSLSGLKQLESIDISYNNKISVLNISDCDKLKYFACKFCNITALDVSNNTKLSSLYLGWNQVETIDISNNTLLAFLNCIGNKLTNLNVTNNPSLEELNCSYNKLTRLDVSKNIVLSKLYCESNKISSINLNNSLQKIVCGSNNLNTLDVSHNTSLTYLMCELNQISELDVSKNVSLQYLSCHTTQLTRLDLSNNLELSSLLCFNTFIKELDVSKNLKMTYLVAWGCPNLSVIWLAQNQVINDFYYDTGVAEIHYK